jgi:hypothetical protein
MLAGNINAAELRCVDASGNGLATGTASAGGPGGSLRAVNAATSPRTELPGLATPGDADAWEPKLDSDGPLVGRSAASGGGALPANCRQSADQTDVCSSPNANGEGGEPWVVAAGNAAMFLTDAVAEASGGISGEPPAKKLGC